jgi:hypothetical protein
MRRLEHLETRLTPELPEATSSLVTYKNHRSDIRQKREEPVDPDAGRAKVRVVYRSDPAAVANVPGDDVPQSNVRAFQAGVPMQLEGVLRGLVWIVPRDKTARHGLGTGSFTEEQ